MFKVDLVLIWDEGWNKIKSRLFTTKEVSSDPESPHLVYIDAGI
jgi:hypothetical protein